MIVKSLQYQLTGISEVSRPKIEGERSQVDYEEVRV